MESGHPDSPVVSSHPCLPASQKSGDALVPPPVWLPWLFTTWLGARLLVEGDPSQSFCIWASGNDALSIFLFVLSVAASSVCHWL